MTFQARKPRSYAAATPPRSGRISLVGAGPGAADLLTLRAVDRLRAADVVFHDRLVSPEVLDLCGPQTRRVFVGKAVGGNLWPQDRINDEITRAALSGLQVVRLKSGDPSIFGRACEEIAAAEAHGIPVEIVPGITAASAGAASLTHPLTERGITDRLVIATATCRPGDPCPDLAEMAKPGTTLALYMAMQRLEEVQAQLLACGLDPDLPISILSNIATRSERLLETPLHALAQAARAAEIANPAIVYVRVPKLAVAVTEAARAAAA